VGKIFFELDGVRITPTMKRPWRRGG